MVVKFLFKYFYLSTVIFSSVFLLQASAVTISASQASKISTANTISKSASWMSISHPLMSSHSSTPYTSLSLSLESPDSSSEPPLDNTITTDTKEPSHQDGSQNKDSTTTLKYHPWLYDHSFQQLGHLLGNDLQAFYSPLSLGTAAISIGVAGGLSSTSVDQSIYHTFDSWPQATSKTFVFSNYAFVSIFAGAWAFDLINVVSPNKYFGTAGYFGEQMTRALLVSYPSVFVLSYLLGSSRPNNKDNKSSWYPMRDKAGVSQQMYFASLPFATLTFMTSNIWVITGSSLASSALLLTSLNKDAYLSQALLGLTFSYVGAFVVNRTHGKKSSVSLMPFVLPHGAGLSISYHF